VGVGLDGLLVCVKIIMAVFLGVSTVGTYDIKNYNVAERLRDQRTVTIRAVRPDDKGLIIDGIKEVSADSIYRRFLMAKQEITPQDLKQATEVDFVNVVALVAVLEKDGRDQIAGGGRYIRTGPSGGGQRAEVAFLVIDSFQGLGIASLIFKHLLAIARHSGITQFEAEVLPSNEAMLRVFARSGIPMTRTATRDTVHVLMDLTGGAAAGSRADEH
jgi:GNAT superfamily N-acetyltransferase